MSALACARCGEPFLREHYLRMHEVAAHADDLAPEEAARCAEARAFEEAWHAEVRRRVRGMLVALPAACVYLLVLLLVHVAGIPLWFGLLLLPGALAFCGLLYLKASAA